MDYPQTAAWERHVQQQVMSVFGPLQSARTVDEIDRRLANMQGDLEKALDEAFDRIYEQAIIFVLLFMMQEDAGYQPFVDEFRRDPRLAADLGTQQARRVAAEVADSTRRRVVEFRGRPRLPSTPDGGSPATPAPEFNDFRDGLFGPQRAEAISITETTDAISRAETEAAGIVTNSTGPHVLVGTWQTSEDEKVCPICAPLHGASQAVYRLTFPYGPPAHPRCRCRIVWSHHQLQQEIVRATRVAKRMLLWEVEHGPSVGQGCGQEDR